MGTVIAWTDVTARYPELDKLQNATSPETQDTLIMYAEAAVHSRLASAFSVPFSSSNITARDICVDMLYVQNMLSRQPEKAEAVDKSLQTRFEALLNGSAGMVDSTGTTTTTMVGETVWSNTMDYHPTFGLSDATVLAVSSAALIDENYDRGVTFESSV